eukprot:jgi/Mesen1/4608/ME000234S03867
MVAYRYFCQNCVNGKPESRQFCGTGLIYDNDVGGCIPPGNSLCPALRPCCFEKSDSRTLYRDPADCGRYCSCQDGYEVATYRCNFGDYFDETAQACVLKEQTTCSAPRGCCSDRASDGYYYAPSNCQCLKAYGRGGAAGQGYLGCPRRCFWGH